MQATSRTARSPAGDHRELRTHQSGREGACALAETQQLRDGGLPGSSHLLVGSGGCWGAWSGRIRRALHRARVCPFRLAAWQTTEDHRGSSSVARGTADGEMEIRTLGAARADALVGDRARHGGAHGDGIEPTYERAKDWLRREGRPPCRHSKVEQMLMSPPGMIGYEIRAVCVNCGWEIACGTRREPFRAPSHRNQLVELA